jgi:outer membrane protein TolC
MNLSNFRTAVADAKAMVDRGDLAAARTRLKDLDKFWDGAMAARLPRPSRVGGAGRSTAGSIALSWGFDHIGRMRPWATKRLRISSPSSIR